MGFARESAFRVGAESDIAAARSGVVAIRVYDGKQCVESEWCDGLTVWYGRHVFLTDDADGWIRFGAPEFERGAVEDQGADAAGVQL